VTTRAASNFDRRLQTLKTATTILSRRLYPGNARAHRFFLLLLPISADRNRLSSKKKSRERNCPRIKGTGTTTMRLLQGSIRVPELPAQRSRPSARGDRTSFAVCCKRRPPTPPAHHRRRLLILPTRLLRQSSSRHLGPSQHLLPRSSSAKLISSPLFDSPPCDQRPVRVSPRARHILIVPLVSQLPLPSRPWLPTMKFPILLPLPTTLRPCLAPGRIRLCPQLTVRRGSTEQSSMRICILSILISRPRIRFVNGLEEEELET
jgi:hypothetical protein